MAGLSIFPGERIIGTGYVVPTVALFGLSYWVMRVIMWPGALIEAIVVIPVSFIIFWKFLRVGVWIDGELLIVRNSWETIRVPIDKAILRSGYVDDISEFDRFTGGHANKMRSQVGDAFADRTFLRYRLVIDGEEHEIDAFFGRTPKGQQREAEKLAGLVRTESFNAR